MDRRTYLTGLAAVATGTGGCLRFAGDEGTPTVTAAPETAETPTDTPTEAVETTAGTSDFPVGLSSNGVSLLLLDKHVSELASTSYTVDYVRRNVTQSRRNAETLAVQGQQALFNQHTKNVDLFIEITPAWYDPVTWRARNGGEWLYGDLDICCMGNNRALAYAKRGHGGSWQFLYWALKGGDYSAPTATAGGDGFRVTADSVDDANPILARFEADRVTSFSASGTVTPAGIVSGLNVSVEVVRNNQLDAHEAAFDISDIGGTTVTVPEWVSTARTRAPTLAVNLRDDRRGVVYMHEGGDPVPEGSNVGLHHQEQRLAPASDESRLDRAFSPGDTLTVFVDGDRVTHVFGGLPSDADAKELPEGGYTDLESPAGAPYFKKGFEDLG